MVMFSDFYVNVFRYYNFFNLGFSGFINPEFYLIGIVTI